MSAVPAAVCRSERKPGALRPEQCTFLRFVIRGLKRPLIGGVQPLVPLPGQPLKTIGYVIIAFPLAAGCLSRIVLRQSHSWQAGRENEGKKHGAHDPRTLTV